MDLEIHQQIFIPRTPAQIWDFLLNQDGLKRWFQVQTFVVDIDEGGGFKFSIQDLLGRQGLPPAKNPPGNLVRRQEN